MNSMIELRFYCIVAKYHNYNDETLVQWNTKISLDLLYVRHPLCKRSTEKIDIDIKSSNY